MEKSLKGIHATLIVIATLLALTFLRDGCHSSNAIGSKMRPINVTIVDDSRKPETSVKE